MAESVALVSGELRLEGLLDRGSESQGVVITHPHPLYGGDMYNYVVETIASAYREKGYTTLRFNFRGVGASEGHFDNGAGERSDTLAALDHMAGLGLANMDLAGYSFGAWVCGMAAQEDPAPRGVQRLVMVSPPAGSVDPASAKRIDSLKLVVTGSMDDIAPEGRIREILPKWNPDARLEVIDGADHFYSGHIDRLLTTLSANL